MQSLIHLTKNEKEYKSAMTEKELDRLYDILEKLTDSNEIAALKKAIFILENDDKSN